MKKRILVLVLVTMLAATSMSACSNAEPKATDETGTAKTTLATTAPKKDLTKETAEAITNELKKGVATIDNIIVYTAENDPNKMLGRPNQYTGKVNFADNRVEQTDKESPVGGSVEVFANKKDATARKEYIAQFATTPALTQYMYLYENVLLRIDNKLTPAQAKEYETAFANLQK